MGTSPALPQFVIIGAMKSATTTLYRYLCRHPQIFMCSPKEPQYFSRDAVFAKGETWYRSLFAEAGAEQVCGEASTCYSRYPQYPGVPARLRAANPDVKLIYLMRHPVERAYSHYKHRMRGLLRRREPILSFEEEIRHEPDIIDGSDYMMQIEQYLAHFDRSQLLLLTTDEMQLDCQAVLSRLQRFLGVEVLDLMAEGTVRANEADAALERQAWRQMVSNWRKRTRLAPLIEMVPQEPRRTVGRWLRQTPLARSIARRRAMSAAIDVPELNEALRQELLARFAEPTARLEAFLNRNLEAWRR